jgi:hypothetical protein
MDTSEKTINEKAREILSQFGFGAFADGKGWEDDGSFLRRLVWRLSDDIQKALPAIQPSPETECGWDRLTRQEREYSRHFFYLEHESLILPLFRNEGWSIRRVHLQLVAMLRALIALDPENLAERAVIVPGEEVANVEQGQASAADVATSEIDRLASTRVDGHMLRYGMYLGLAMALEGTTEHADLTRLARQLADEVGANDPLDRPAYKMDARSAEFVQEMREQRDAKENS